MRIRLVSFTKKGAKLCKFIEDRLNVNHNALGYTVDKFSKELKLKSLKSLSLWTKLAFEKSDALVFIGACGIAVRSVVPYVANKTKDPAVIVIDEKGEYIIPILSGHIGGANNLALEISKIIKGIPIISTATDINNKFSVDSFAVKNNLYIGDMNLAKKISARVLENGKIGFVCGFPIKGRVPNDLVLKEREIGIVISFNEKLKPFKETLNLIPRIISLGIGCRKGISLIAVENLVFKALKENNISIHSLKNICSINIKANEKALIEFSKKYNLEFKTFTPKMLLSLKGEFTKSKFVKEITGVDNICERAAVLGSLGELIVKKTCENGVTVALAKEKGEIYFEDFNDRNRS